MKIILTGSTGYIGNEVLLQCLANPSITSIIALSRRNLKISDPKLKVIIHEDFTTYPPELMTQLADADACIYCLGSNVPVKPPELNQKINFDYAITTARTFAGFFNSSNSAPMNKSFKFVYLSGALPEKDPEKKLWFLAENRRMRGELENALLQLGKEKEGTGFEVFVARPGFVQKEGAVLKAWLVGLVGKYIFMPDLAASMVDVALHGYSRPIIENEMLVELGRKVATRGNS
ncbi:uncharacterized protein LY89DRAFT_242206 [Mollisia scopiformis]|uniref:NAD(P)-binding domain-containing protein n=1 Tax=Mollisia scopiformis TaxID=149040 RepID=A0A194WTL6_MOLSC|nr:uncharacterized protein LY89DRAFT_242206 [Mollisia scopiformis]KUJ11303.1 hypothetical protein LY89DRAFT_242206 [Mollisia scopiformis]